MTRMPLVEYQVKAIHSTDSKITTSVQQYQAKLLYLLETAILFSSSL